MEKTNGEILQEKLFDKKENVKVNKDIVFKFCDEYIDFLNKCKTERQCVKYFEKDLIEKGFQNINSVKQLKINDKVYYVNRNKTIYAAIIGNNIDSLNIIGSHIDSPRLDLKPNPLYEDGSFALFKTHYYGGIKKYQWTAIPLAMHGVVVKTNGEKIDITIGEDENDPVFTITDLLPHLAKDQMEKKLSESISGEQLNILIGSTPFEDDKIKDKIKLNILNILNKKYGIVEKDFTSAEIEFVPAFKAKSLGFDESMIAAYGQDDRSCAYTSYRAFTSLNNIDKTAVLILADKEEIGSVGNTGMCSRNFEYFISLLIDKLNSDNTIESVLCHSKMLSADVTAAADPTYAYVDEKNNAAYLGKGISICKYTGSRGKSGASDASAEFVAYVRGIFEKNNLNYQVTDMGKVDTGGGGTIAYILANKGIDVIDAGVAILSMHCPYEVSSKADIYNAYECYKAFFENCSNIE